MKKYLNQIWLGAMILGIAAAIIFKKFTISLIIPAIYGIYISISFNIMELIDWYLKKYKYIDIKEKKNGKLKMKLSSTKKESTI